MKIIKINDINPILQLEKLHKEVLKFKEIYLKSFRNSTNNKFINQNKKEENNNKLELLLNDIDIFKDLMNKNLNFNIKNNNDFKENRFINKQNEEYKNFKNIYQKNNEKRYLLKLNLFENYLNSIKSKGNMENLFNRISLIIKEKKYYKFDKNWPLFITKLRELDRKNNNESFFSFYSHESIKLNKLFSLNYSEIQKNLNDTFKDFDTNKNNIENISFNLQKMLLFQNSIKYFKIKIDEKNKMIENIKNNFSINKEIYNNNLNK